MTLPDLPGFRWEVLASANEDSLMLVHVWWEAAKFGDDPRLSARLALAETVVLDLLKRGFLEVGRMGPPQSTLDWGPVPSDQVEELLTHYGSWVAPHDEHLWLQLTQAGKLALNQAVNRQIP